MRRIVGLAVAALAVCGCNAPAATPVAHGDPQAQAIALPDLPRSRIVLMSSLPLVYGDHDDMAALIAGQGEPHPLYTALKAAHDLVVADALDEKMLAGADLVLLVQPRALPPEALVALDGYVRTGGRLLLFADPALEWPSRLGLGDPRGPVRSTLISPLLAHWGLKLVNPDSESVRLPRSGAMLHHPGQFLPKLGMTGDGRCALREAGHVARCRPGKGQAILVADADLLNPPHASDSGDSWRDNNRFAGGLLRDLLAEDSS